MRGVHARLLARLLAWRFRPDQAAGLSAVIELRVLGPGNRAAVPITATIRDGHCTVAPGVAEQPGMVATLALATPSSLAMQDLATS